MPGDLHEVAVIGGGPGGSSAALYLAKLGRKVILLEKEFFPRFHVGESLLPYNARLFEELDLWPALRKAAFTRKFGAQFHTGNGSKSIFFVFAQGRFTKEKETIQVERATFDHLLLQQARARGVDVREGWTVQRFSAAPDSISLEATDPDSRPHQLQCRFLIDASGRSNLTANQERLRTVHPDLKKMAIFGHFKNVRTDSGERGGDTVIVRLADKWFWLIPLSPEKVSVGCVLDQAEFIRCGETPTEIFFRLSKSTPAVRERMEHAKLVTPLHTTGDFSYYNLRLVSHRLLRVGDAAGFMDPIFSAGVFLAMVTGKWAAETTAAALPTGTDGARALRRYERRVRSAMAIYWEMVRRFYTAPFLELFFEPRERFHLASAINAILAGELEGGWKLRWRLRLFFFLVNWQARHPFMPKLDFG